MNAWIAASAARSYRAGVVTGFGAMSADAVLGATVYLVERIVNIHAAVRFVYLVGAGVMAFLGARLLRPADAAGREPPEGSTFLRALAIGLSNPFQVIWWLTAGVAFAYFGGPVLFLGLFGAIALWVVAFPWAVHSGTRRHPAVERGVRYTSAGILLGFALYFAVTFVIG